MLPISGDMMQERAENEVQQVGCRLVPESNRRNGLILQYTVNVCLNVLIELET